METWLPADDEYETPDIAKHVNVDPDRFSWRDGRCPGRKNFVSSRRQFFEKFALANSNNAESSDIHHVCCAYENGQNRNSLASTATTDEYDNVADVEDVFTDLTDSSQKEYGFYNIFPGLPDEDLEDIIPVIHTRLFTEETEINSIEKLYNDVKKKIDNMSGPEIVVDDDDIINCDVVNKVLSENNEVSNNESVIDTLVVEAKESKRNSIVRDLSGTINELLSTEKSYVVDLEYVCNTYMVQTKSSRHSATSSDSLLSVFGNFEKIKDFHKNHFLPALEKCNEVPEKLCNTFITFRDQLYCYTEYAFNKPLSQKIMNEETQFFERMRVNIGDIMGLSSFLLKPLQRLVKYRQLIERIGKNLRKLEIDDIVDYSGFMIHTKTMEYSAELSAAIEAEAFLTDLQQQGNDVLMVPYITKCPHSLECLRLVKSTKLTVNKRSIKYQVFLFETLLLFTEPIILNKEELFLYKDSIQLDRILPPVECQKSQSSFTITSSENKSRIFYIKCANTDERASWIAAIRNILSKQIQALKEAAKSRSLELDNSSQRMEKTKKSNVIKIPSITKCPHNLDEMGQLRKCGKLTITHRNQMYIGQVILYEKVMLFTSIVNHHYEELLTYESSILGEHLSVSQSMGNSDTKFHVWCSRTNASHVLQAKSSEAKNAWIKQLDRIVKEQESLRLRNSMAEREYSTISRFGPAMGSLRGVPGECNRRSLPPIPSIQHLSLVFDECPNNSVSADDVQNIDDIYEN